MANSAIVSTFKPQDKTLIEMTNRVEELFKRKEISKAPGLDERQAHVTNIPKRADAIKLLNDKIADQAALKNKHKGDLESLGTIERNIQGLEKMIAGLLLTEFQSEVGSFIWKTFAQDDLNTIVSDIKSTIPERFHKAVTDLLKGLGREVTA